MNKKYHKENIADIISEIKNRKNNCYNCSTMPFCGCYIIGATGPQGIGVVLNYADFYALMPLDNAATVAPEFSTRLF